MMAEPRMDFGSWNPDGAGAQSPGVLQQQISQRGGTGPAYPPGHRSPHSGGGSSGWISYSTIPAKPSLRIYRLGSIDLVWLSTKYAEYQSLGRAHLLQAVHVKDARTRHADI
eukprot:SAG31_NODE_7076_length_1795_cov_1.841392_1_plen_112_part_00